MQGFNSKKGFTLLEIMIIVSIIGILSLLSTLAVLEAAKNARIKTAEIELAMISVAVEQLAWDTGRWPNKAIRTNPGSSEIWDITSDACGLMGTDGSYSDWKGPYYDGPTIDPWGRPYFFDPDYYPVTGGKYIAVGSFGTAQQSMHAYDDNDVVLTITDWNDL